MKSVPWALIRLKLKLSWVHFEDLDAHVKNDESLYHSQRATSMPWALEKDCVVPSKNT